MAEKNKKNGKSTGEKSGAIALTDTNYIESLAKIVVNHDLSELKIADDDMNITLKRGGEMITQMVSAPAMPVAMQAAMQADTQMNTGQATAPSNEAIIPGFQVRSPMVGTAYMSPQPGAASFVKEGDIVKEGDTLMIVEAMKVMNPIVSPCDGKIMSISINNGQPVEFDEVLMVVES